MVGVCFNAGTDTLRISGYGWGFGYLGGLLAMLLAMVGFVSPDVPWFGLNPETGAHIRGTNFVVAIWFFIFTLPDRKSVV